MKSNAYVKCGKANQFSPSCCSPLQQLKCLLFSLIRWTQQQAPHSVLRMKMDGALLGSWLCLLVNSKYLSPAKEWLQKCSKMLSNVLWLQIKSICAGFGSLFLCATSWKWLNLALWPHRNAKNTLYSKKKKSTFDHFRWVFLELWTDLNKYCKKTWRFINKTTVWLQPH